MTSKIYICNPLSYKVAKWPQFVNDFFWAVVEFEKSTLKAIINEVHRKLCPPTLRASFPLFDKFFLQRRMDPP
jgi:hypothetical protein